MYVSMFESQCRTAGLMLFIYVLFNLTLSDPRVMYGSAFLSAFGIGGLHDITTVTSD